MTERERLIEIFKNTKYKAYECTPETTVANQFSAYALCHIVDEFLKKGIMVPPCRVGDIMYYIGKSTDLSALHNTIYKTDVVKIIHKEEGISIVLRFYNGPYCFAEITEINDFGKRIFLTKEEAEKALEECEK